ncbi:MAG: glycosyltransferase family 4 protein [Candidatus Thermoplasmatota archaeon]|nr:glycosyltransferase family 4 protein [Candidatus Thermoplasmatota archaeon]
MKVNFIVEDSGPLKYLGCATAAKNLFHELSKKIDVSWNDKSFDYDVAHFHTFGPRSMLYAKRFQGKKIITAHSTPNLNTGNLAFPRAVNWLYIPIYNTFDHIIAVSDKCKKELIDLHCKPGISTIYNGIDVEKNTPTKTKREKFRKKHGIEKGKTVVLTVAQRTPRKGIYDFLEIAKQLPQFCFLWIGGFPYNLFSKDYTKIKRAIGRRSENTIFPGFIEDITDAYSAADVFFMPSYAEGHSIVMLEALSMGLPLIARDVEEFREAFDGNLLYFKNIEELDEKKFDKETLEVYRKKSDVVSNYTIEKMAQDHTKLYEKIIGL